MERRDEDRVERFVIDYAFGSGHHAMTFVSVVDPDAPRAFEHRLTYFRDGDRIAITPGHSVHDKGHPMEGWTPEGRVLSPRITKKCFRCHTTRISIRGRYDLDEATMIPNVGCERCHGSGRSHVDAARTGDDASLQQLAFGLDRPDAGRDADAVLRLCGQCHRHPSQAPKHRIRADDPGLARFQPVGLMQSACYQKSEGRFSCLSCHDPHSKVSASASHYEAICLSCHQAPESSPGGRNRPELSDGAQFTGAFDSGVRCPVSPADGCISCHMPRVDSGQRVLFADHWIRVRGRPDSEPSTPGVPVTTEGDFTDP